MFMVYTAVVLDAKEIQQLLTLYCYRRADRSQVIGPCVQIHLRRAKRKEKQS